MTSRVSTGGIRDIVGEDRFSTDQDFLLKYGRGEGLVPDGKASCVIYPRDSEDIRGIVRLANAKGFNLVPRSSAVPGTYGGAVPSGEGVVVDLSEMKEIVRLDRRNKVALIEPGVTFGELQAAAASEGLKVLMPLVPRATKSVLASYLEREPITIPKYHWDMTDPLLCIEVVFGTGDTFRTGGAAGPGTLEEQWKSGAAQKNPLGPAHTDFAKLVQGSQGTMGIVSWASVKLELLPRSRRLFFIQARDLAELQGFTYRALRLRLGDEFLVLNSFNLASMLRENRERIGALMEKQSPWTLVFCVAGYEYFPQERAAFQESDIRDVAKQSGLEVTEEVPGASSEAMMRLLDGTAEGTCWKSRYLGGHRDIFFLTTLDRAPGFIEVMNGSLESCGYHSEEMGIYIQPIQHGRACHLEFNLPFDPDDREGREKIDSLFLKASAELMDAGAFFSRPYGPWAEMAYARCPDSVEALNKVKGIVDPNGIMNRGKLCFTGR